MLEFLLGIFLLALGWGQPPVTAEEVAERIENFLVEVSAPPGVAVAQAEDDEDEGEVDEENEEEDEGDEENGENEETDEEDADSDEEGTESEGDESETEENETDEEDGPSLVEVINKAQGVVLGHLTEVAVENSSVLELCEEHPGECEVEEEIEED